MPRERRKRMMSAFTPLAACAVMLGFLFGCAAATGPSYTADGSGARSTFAPSSNIALLADGNWSASSPQQFATSGVDITDDRASAIMPENVNGFRATSDSITFLSGGSLYAGFTLAFADGSVERWEVERLEADKSDFYSMVEVVTPMVASAIQALGDDATEQVVAWLRAEVDKVEAVAPEASVFLRSLLTALTGAP